MPNDNVLTEQIRAVCNAHIVTMGDDFALGADRLAKRILALLAAHPGQQEPRAEVTDKARMDWLCERVVNVRDPYPLGGSRDLFWASPHEDDSGFEPSDLRAKIDAARAGGQHADQA